MQVFSIGNLNNAQQKFRKPLKNRLYMQLKAVLAQENFFRQVVNFLYKPEIYSRLRSLLFNQIPTKSTITSPHLNRVKDLVFVQNTVISYIGLPIVLLSLTGFWIWLQDLENFSYYNSFITDASVLS